MDTGERDVFAHPRDQGDQRTAVTVSWDYERFELPIAKQVCAPVEANAAALSLRAMAREAAAFQNSVCRCQTER